MHTYIRESPKVSCVHARAQTQIRTHIHVFTQLSSDACLVFAHKQSTVCGAVSPAQKHHALFTTTNLGLVWHVSCIDRST